MRLLFLIPCLALVACGEPVERWSELPAAPQEGRGKSQVDRAASARDELSARLVSRLQAAMASGGPVAAIGACKDDAPKITRELSDELGLELGRTSFRLRNPENAAPPWARAAIEARREEPAFFGGPEDRLGALYPIRLKAVCTMCHGAPEVLATEVRETLTANYPQDRATGFAEGDLRGWLWVEVP